jgi:hypothetical protein
MSWRAAVDQVRAKVIFFTTCVISLQALRYGVALTHFRFAIVFRGNKVNKVNQERITPLGGHTRI